ncbi:hypothetical protein NMG60_11035524 [Bertholletia excelsa]
MNRLFSVADAQVVQRMKEKFTSSASSMGTISDCVHTSSEQVRPCVAAKERNSNELKQAEESLRTVMYLSCWGPN